MRNIVFLTARNALTCSLLIGGHRAICQNIASFLSCRVDEENLCVTLGIKREEKMIGGITNQKGFTLVEIMMVVIIIGILAVLAIPRYQKYTLESKLAEVAIAVGEIKTGMEKYYNSHGGKYTNIPVSADNADLERILRIDLGEQNNFEFAVSALATGGTTGYIVRAILTASGKANEYNYSTTEAGDAVVYYFPKTLNADWNTDPWIKGWNDDEFFQ